ncbi:MAG TPA: hypothetical protein VHB51_00705 [Candidatus Saccharimonadales bacterium]|nr:hypothetical protein [Candidatus Saccharimonadales bacterium]
MTEQAPFQPVTPPVEQPRTPDFGDLSAQEQVRQHADWKMRVDTTPHETGAKPSKNGITAEDIAYDMWLAENAAEAHAGKTVKGKIKEEKAAQEAAARREKMRGFARLEMRVKTGQATGEEAAYYYTLLENAENGAGDGEGDGPSIAARRNRQPEQPEDPGEGNDGGSNGPNDDPNDPGNGGGNGGNGNGPEDPGDGGEDGPDDVDLDLAYAENDLWDSREEYVRLCAEMRNGHLGRIGGGRWKKLMQRFFRGASELSRSQALDRRVQEARAAHREQFANLATLIQSRRVEAGEPLNIRETLVNAQLDDLRAIERRIRRAQQEQFAAERAPGIKGWVAEQWFRRGRFGKFMMVAIPAAAIGVTGGLAAAGLGLGGLLSTAAGIGTAYGGRKAGHKIAKTANAGFASTEQGIEQLTESAANREARFRNRAVRTEDAVIDHTEFVERGNTNRVEDNMRRRRLAGRVGAAVAGATFGFTRVHFDGGGSHATAADPNHAANGHAANTVHGGHGAHGAHGGHNGLGHAAHAEKINPNAYPWTVAHHMTPGHEWDTIHHAIKSANATKGTHYHLVNVGKTLQVYNGNHALNVAQQEAFNRYMESLAS